jgi:sugar phosphate isomerase/epimerase
MYLGYHAYSLVDYYLPSAVQLLSDLGFGGIVLPLSSSRFHPRLLQGEVLTQFAAELDAARSTRNAQFVIDATGQFLLSSVNAAPLTLLDSDESSWEQAVSLLRWTFEMAKKVGSGPVFVRTGPWVDGRSTEEGLEQLHRRLEEIVPLAARVDVTIGIRPVSGDFIATIAGFERLLQWYDSPHLAVVADTSTMFSQMELPLSSCLSRVVDRLCAVILREPTARGPSVDWIDQGSVSPQAVVECLQELDYAGGLFVDSLPSGPFAVETARLISQRMLPWI